MARKRLKYSKNAPLIARKAENPILSWEERIYQLISWDLIPEKINIPRV